MTTSAFRITYDGPALQTSAMDVRELAPALLAIGDLLEAATRSLCGERVTSQINVHGSFRTGSFGIDFTLATSFANRVVELFNSDGMTGISNAAGLLAMLGFARSTLGHGLFAVLKWLRGRRVERIEMRTDSAVLYVETDRIEIELNVLTLLRDVCVRRAAARALAPLSRDGISSFSVGTDSEIVATVDASQLGWFDVPEPPDDLLVDEVRKMAFSIVSLAFKDDNKWRLYDGAATIHASIADANFLQRVDANQETFAKGDVLICNVRVRQWQTQSGAKTDYEVTRVLEHRTVARQIPLPGL